MRIIRFLKRMLKRAMGDVEKATHEAWDTDANKTDKLHDHLSGRGGGTPGSFGGF